MEGLRVSKLEEGQQWGKNTSSKDKVEWGRRPPYIVGGTIQPLPPKQTRRGRYYRRRQRYYRSPGGTTVESGGQESDRPERYCRGGWAVLPLVSGTAALLPLRSTALSDTKNDPSSRRGRGLVP